MWRERKTFPCLTTSAGRFANGPGNLGRKNCQTDRVGNLEWVERRVETPYSLNAGLPGEKCSPEFVLSQAN